MSVRVRNGAELRLEGADTPVEAALTGRDPGRCDNMCGIREKCGAANPAERTGDPRYKQLEDEN